MQGNRLLELLDTMPDLDVYLLNTGRVGGTDEDERSKNVKIKHSSSIVRGIVSGTIVWEEDPDFGYYVAAEFPEFPDYELLRPYRLYERQGRLDEYASIIAALKEERRAYLRSFPDLHPSIVNAI
jgi:phosphoenolpyruvate carboxykinase (ATP)